MNDDTLTLGEKLGYPLAYAGIWLVWAGMWIAHGLDAADAWLREMSE